MVNGKTLGKGVGTDMLRNEALFRALAFVRLLGLGVLLMIRVVVLAAIEIYNLQCAII